ncbi:MAG: hypothetical protein E6959_04645 [Eikenella corrodens]|nr:hypothetical protein [Eikenella corrodens]
MQQVLLRDSGSIPPRHLSLRYATQGLPENSQAQQQPAGNND